MKHLFLFFAMIFSLETYGKGLSELQSLQNWENGDYQVICRDGSFEGIDQFDLKFNNLCPRGQIVTTLNVKAIHQLDNGQFSVICSDLSTAIVSAEQLLEGSLCQTGLRDIGDIANGQEAENGSYRILCKDGSQETVSALDIKLNNVCPRQSLPNIPKTYSSLYRAGDNKFLVTCTDGSHLEATAEQVQNQELCPTPTSQAPTNGTYTVIEGYDPFCDQTIKQNGSPNNPSSITLTFDCSNVSYDYPCNADSCSTMDGRYTVEFIDSTKYRFFRKTSNPQQAVFEQIR